MDVLTITHLKVCAHTHVDASKMDGWMNVRHKEVNTHDTNSRMTHHVTYEMMMR